MDVPAEGRELRGAGIFVVVFKSNLRGRCRAFGPIEGEEGGSFFTTIFGFAWFRELLASISIWLRYVCSTYDRGDLFPPGGVRSVDETSAGPGPYFSMGAPFIAGARGA